MGAVKSAYEKAMEKANAIEELTPEERGNMRERENLRNLLAAFYRGELNRDQAWERFKGMRPSFLLEAQTSIVGTLRPGSGPEEIRHKRDGILAIEALKEKKNAAAIESALTAIEKLQRENVQMKEQALVQLRMAVEQNPQLRMRPVRTPDGRTVLQPALSVDEAVQTKLSEFLAEHEKQYEAAFEKLIVRLRKELR